MSDEKKALALPKLEPQTVLPVQKLRAYGDAMIPQLAAALPPDMRGHAPRFFRVLITEAQRSQYLATCTGLSLMGGLIQAAQLGLEIGGTLGQAYLVPYWNKKVGAREAQFQPGYRGLLTLAHRSGQVKAFFAQEVHARDSLDFELGSNPFVKHKPLIGGDRGDVIGVYAVLQTAAGGTDVEWMSTDEINAHRQKFSKSDKGGMPSPWDGSWGEMAKKTAIRRLSKRTPLTVDLMRAATLSEYDDEGQPQDLRVLAADALDVELPPDRSDRAAEIEAKIEQQ